MKRLVLILLSFTMIACSSLSGIPDRSSDVDIELESLKQYFMPNVITEYNSKGNDSDKLTYRNEVISARLRAIDLNYNEFIKNVSVENKNLNIGTDSAVLILGAAGAISTVTSTQAILSATSATVTGVKSSIDKHAFYNATLSALVSQMNANRQKTKVDIYSGMQKSVIEYPLMRALIDVEDYFQAGTIIGAVNEINKQAGEIKAQADEKISTILKSSYIKDTSGDLIKWFWMPDGKSINKNNEAKLKKWMKDNGIENVSVPFFIYTEKYSDERKKAVKDIPIN